MPDVVKLRMLRITSVPLSKVWFSDMLGELVPLQGFEPGSWRSREPSGHVNFVAQKHAVLEVVSVDSALATQWPWAWGEKVVQPKDKPVPMVATRSVCERVCHETCGRLGICQALEGCQDQHRVDAELARAAAPVGQSRAHSMAETLASIAVGFVVSMVIQALVLPAFGHHITLAENFWITCIFTVASVVRGYGMRRLFNHLHTRSGA